MEKQIDHIKLLRALAEYDGYVYHRDLQALALDAKKYLNAIAPLPAPAQSKAHRCYIAGKITGLSKTEAELNFGQAKLEVFALGMEPISPMDLTHAHGGSWSEYMREDLAELLTCSHIYVQRNYRNSRGAQIEVELASNVGLTRINQNDKAEEVNKFIDCPICKKVTLQVLETLSPELSSPQAWRCQRCRCLIKFHYDQTATIGTL